MIHLIRTFLDDEGGATAIEYALIASLIAMVLITAVGAIGQNLQGIFNNTANGFN